jgi:hypothetical protein
MLAKEWIMIAAILLGPVLAVQAQKWLEKLREQRSRKLWIFRTLMTTRATPVSPQHVEALNMIDLEFSGTSSYEKEVIDAWRDYHDHLNTQVPDDQIHSWLDKSSDLLVEVLFKMSKVLGYKFNKVQLRKGCYIPRAHTDNEMQFLAIRRSLAAILEGKNTIPVSIPMSDDVLKKQEALQEGFLDLLEGKRSIRIKYDNNNE